MGWGWPFVCFQRSLFVVVLFTGYKIYKVKHEVVNVLKLKIHLGLLFSSLSVTTFKTEERDNQNDVPFCWLSNLWQKSQLPSIILKYSRSICKSFISQQKFFVTFLCGEKCWSSDKHSWDIIALVFAVKSPFLAKAATAFLVRSTYLISCLKFHSPYFYMNLLKEVYFLLFAARKKSPISYLFVCLLIY